MQSLYSSHNVKCRAISSHSFEFLTIDVQIGTSGVSPLPTIDSDFAYVFYRSCRSVFADHHLTATESPYGHI